MTEDTPPPKKMIDKAYSIASIKACIPSPLDLDKLNYNSWSNLFQRFCKTYEVHHHLAAPASTSTAPPDPFYEANDSLVVMWIYSTISPKLVDMSLIIAPRLIKYAYRLANLGSPVSDSSLVTYPINGLRAKFPDIARIIRHRDELPKFDKVRSMAHCVGCHNH
ncbi:hypothetical protein CTI12_AA589180 [Artemisia annua]|uniref:Uncharacterized protein n=1 Tax=Artemisia annua TaxID=35608 RepID=A0A2U1KI51_ARTAN|nr:hypothetical protein CTI12_AA589180 [Artemisia annua]